MGLNIPLWERRFATLKSLLKTLDDNKAIGARIYEEFEQAEDAADEKLNEYGNSVVRYGSLLSSFWDQLYNATEYNVYAPVDNDVKLPTIPTPLLRKSLKPGNAKEETRRGLPKPVYNPFEYEISVTEGGPEPPIIYNDYSFIGEKLSDWVFDVFTRKYSTSYIPEVPLEYSWEGLKISDFTAIPSDTTSLVHTYTPVQTAPPPKYRLSDVFSAFKKVKGEDLYNLTFEFVENPLYNIETSQSITTWNGMLEAATDISTAALADEHRYLTVGGFATKIKSLVTANENEEEYVLRGIALSDCFPVSDKTGVYTYQLSLSLSKLYNIKGNQFIDTNEEMERIAEFIAEKEVACYLQLEKDNTPCSLTGVEPLSQSPSNMVWTLTFSNMVTPRPEDNKWTITVIHEGMRPAKYRFNGVRLSDFTVDSTDNTLYSLFYDIKAISHRELVNMETNATMDTATEMVIMSTEIVSHHLAGDPFTITLDGGITGELKAVIDKEFDKMFEYVLAIGLDECTKAPVQTDMYTYDYKLSDGLLDDAKDGSMIYTIAQMEALAIKVDDSANLCVISIATDDILCTLKKVEKVGDGTVWRLTFVTEVVIDVNDQYWTIQIVVKDPNPPVPVGPQYIISKKDDKAISTLELMQDFLSVFSHGTECYMTLLGDETKVAIESIVVHPTLKNTWNIRIKSGTIPPKRWISSDNSAIGYINTQEKMATFAEEIGSGRVRLLLTGEDIPSYLVVETAVVINAGKAAWKIEAYEYAIPVSREEKAVQYDDYAWINAEIGEWTLDVPSGEYRASYVPQVPSLYQWEQVTFGEFIVSPEDNTFYLHQYVPTQKVVPPATSSYIVGADGLPIDTEAKMVAFAKALEDGDEVFSLLEGDQSAIRVYGAEKIDTTTWIVSARPVPEPSKKWIFSSDTKIGNIDTHEKMTAFQKVILDGKTRLLLTGEVSAFYMLMKTVARDAQQKSVWRMEATIWEAPYFKYRWFNKLLSSFTPDVVMQLTWEGVNFASFTPVPNDLTFLYFHVYLPGNTFAPLQPLKYADGTSVSTQEEMNEIASSLVNGMDIRVKLLGDSPVKTIKLEKAVKRTGSSGEWDIYGRVNSTVPVQSYTSEYDIKNDTATPIYVMASNADHVGVLLNTKEQMATMVSDIGKEYMILDRDETELTLRRVYQIPYPYIDYVWDGVGIGDFEPYEKDTLCVEKEYDLSALLPSQKIRMVSPDGTTIKDIDTALEMTEMMKYAIENKARITLFDGTYLRIVTVDVIGQTSKYYIVCSQYDQPPVPPTPDKATYVEWTSMRITDLLPDTSNGMALFGMYDLDDIRRPMYVVDNSTLVPTKRKVDTVREIDELRAELSGVRIKLSDGTILKVFSILQNDLNIKQFQFECSVTSYAWAKGTLEWLKGDSQLLYNDINKIVTQWLTLSPKDYFESMQAHQEHMAETLTTVNNFLALMNTQAGGGNASPAPLENINSDYAYYNNQ